MVTLVGVAYRGNIALEAIAVDFEVEPTFANDGVGFGVRESVTLHGKISELERGYGSSELRATVRCDRP